MINLKNRLSLLGLAFAVVIISGTVIVSSQANQKKAEVSSPSGLKQKPNTHKIPLQRKTQNEYVIKTIPKDVVYRQLFKHIEELNRKADKLERKGKNGKNLRKLYKKMARLDEKQAITLDKIAKKTNRELKKLDKRAEKIIKKLRSQTPNRRIESGQKIPLPSQELIDLAKQREEISLKAIRELQESFKHDDFNRFDQFVNEIIKPNIKKKGNGTVIKNGGKRR